MLATYSPNGSSCLARVEFDSADLAAVPADAIWLDLLNPSPAEDRAVESLVGVAIPTAEEMQEIEPSSRLYSENGALFMTASLLCQSESAKPRVSPVTFILAGERLVTVRYDEPRPFAILGTKLTRTCAPGATGVTIFMELLEAIVDRAADTLERISADIDNLSARIFEITREPNGQVDYQHILRSIGRKGDLLSKAREALVSVGRLLQFMQNEAEKMRLSKPMRALLKSMSRDAGSLSDHATYLGEKVAFLLDATLGLVNIEQNYVIKIFAVLSVVLMPPTLVASAYGMNFKHMPELEWVFGYPWALFLMLAAAVMPYLFFRWKKWL